MKHDVQILVLGDAEAGDWQVLQGFAGLTLARAERARDAYLFMWWHLHGGVPTLRVVEAKDVEPG
jgi:hypothetical protein